MRHVCELQPFSISQHEYHWCLSAWLLSFCCKLMSRVAASALLLCPPTCAVVLLLLRQQAQVEQLACAHAAAAAATHQARLRHQRQHGTARQGCSACCNVHSCTLHTTSSSSSSCCCIHHGGWRTLRRLLPGLSSLWIGLLFPASGDAAFA